jgi:hypothetical protein
MIAPASDVDGTPIVNSAAYAACTVAPSFPTAFGGSSIPQVLPDP